MQNDIFQPLIKHFEKNHLASFNLDEYKHAQIIPEADIFEGATVLKGDGEKNCYLLFASEIDESNRPVILKKVENAIENLKTTFALSNTCKYMYQNLNAATKELEKKITEELLFSDLNHDFYRLIIPYDKFFSNALDLYNACPNILFLMGKILVSNIPYQKTRGAGDKTYDKWFSYHRMRSAVYNLLNQHELNIRLQLSQPLIFIDMGSLGNHNKIKDKIIQKLLKGVPSNTWHELSGFPPKNDYSLLKLSLIIKKEKAKDRDGVPIKISNGNFFYKYFFMKTKTQLNNQISYC